MTTPVYAIPGSKAQTRSADISATALRQSALPSIGEFNDTQTNGTIYLAVVPRTPKPTASAILSSGATLGISGVTTSPIAAGSLITPPPSGWLWVDWAGTNRNLIVSNLTAVAYGSGYFVAVGSGGLILRSPDGLAWTQQTDPTGGAAISFVTYGNGVFLAIVNNGPSGKSHAVISTDAGATWTMAQFPGQSSATFTMRNAQFDGSQFIISGFSYSAQFHYILLRSVDGVNFTQSTSIATGSFPFTQKWSKTGVNDIPFSFNGNSVVVSDDSVNWDNVQSVAVYGPFVVTPDQHLVIAGGNGFVLSGKR